MAAALIGAKSTFGVDFLGAVSLALGREIAFVALGDLAIV
jgi:hypothetical protein